DINPAKTDEILQLAEANGLTCVGNIHYGNAVTEAQCAGQTVIEYGEPCMAGDFGNVWKNTIALLK
ncbi:MAG TPA: hypothetical protein VJC18_10615, partial [bacterium]|nr:hypothetical protein [bacterium]